MTKRRRRSSPLFLRTTSVPLFQQNGPARWEHKGQFQAVNYVLAQDQPTLVENYRKQAGRPTPVMAIIEMEKSST